MLVSGQKYVQRIHTGWFHWNVTCKGRWRLRRCRAGETTSEQQKKPLLPLKNIQALRIEGKTANCRPRYLGTQARLTRHPGSNLCLCFRISCGACEKDEILDSRTLFPPNPDSRGEGETQPILHISTNFIVNMDMHLGWIISFDFLNVTS